MHLIKVHLRCFRAYDDLVSMNIGDLTAITGRNDIGKSTVLDALNIVLGDGKFEADDVCVHAIEKDSVSIECEFEVDPDEQIVIDQDAKTSWKAEHLLNSDERLHVVWEFDGTKKTPAASMWLRAFQDDQGLLNLKNTDLKSKLTDDQKSDQAIHKNNNVELRAAIRSTLSKDQFKLRKVELKSEDGKKTAEMIKARLPKFRLFKSDRNSTDQDGEVQDPMKEAIKEAVAECGEEARRVLDKVLAKAKEWETAMLDKLNELDPEAATGVSAHHDTPDLSKSFKMTLKDDNGVALNKRGSGVRRLVLLSFFRVAAERAIDASAGNPIIYGIEEPETSQHPTNQRKIVRALIELASASGRQVILTTHVPGLASELPTNSIRYIRGEKGACPQIIEGDEALSAATDALGVLPDPRHPKLLFYVEGYTDADFFMAIGRLLKVAGEITLNVDDIAFVPTGGSSLKHWVDRRYLESLNIPEMHVYDRDVIAPGTSKFKYQEHVDRLVSEGKTAELTGHREIENYVHPEAVISVYSKDGVDLKGLSYSPEADAPLQVATLVYERSTNQDWLSLPKESQDEKISKAKKRMMGRDVLSQMTVERLYAVDPKGDVRRWLTIAHDLIEGNTS